MPLRPIRVRDVAPQSWHNGGGYTRELLAWPSVEQWDLRISVADIEVDGPFSAFDGVERWISMIAGVGVALRFANREVQLAPGDEPLKFDGAAAPYCRLLGGATRDLNLMVRNGDGVMRPVLPNMAWTEGFAMRGLFSATAGRWTTGDESCEVAAMTLLWTDASAANSAWTFQPDSHQNPAGAWWLGFTPQGTQTHAHRAQ